jgi:glucose-1-phosphate thymidylyltransferase
MKCLILAAGYATRLYPLTENFPKPLLKVGEKTILDWLIDDIGEMADSFAVISNHRFAEHFRAWAEGHPMPITVVDDGTCTNETRLGAVRDIWFAVDRLKIRDDCLVLAGDNVLDFSLRSLIRYARDKKTSCVMRYWEPDEQRLRKAGVGELDGDRLIRLEEKPAEPRSHWCTPPFYYYTAEDLARIPEAIDAGCGTDAPGSLVAWMCRHSVMHAMEMPGQRYDIGDLAGYERIRREYRGIVR